ncbi:MAG: hypothetical protein HRT86_15935 [Ilumatobacteraceae bacterium]|nr:hypothetical protein [Ilumatobacteraceae bacterium]
MSEQVAGSVMESADADRFGGEGGGSRNRARRGTGVVGDRSPVGRFAERWLAGCAAHNPEKSGAPTGVG